MTDVKITRALLSVSDKTGLIDFARALHGHGVELVSTGGTARAIAEAGLPVKEVAELTGFPEMMDGRVKTLHPTVHGGILARRDLPEHTAAMARHGIGAIDLVVVNLYPFEATVARGAAWDETVENIDIGGPAMIRSAAKNHAFVAVVTDVEDYDAVIAEMDAKGGAASLALRTRLAATAYGRTGAYDSAIGRRFAAETGEIFPRRIGFAGTRSATLRYGENPHQQAAFYADGSNRPGIATARQVQGKELSFNNLNDTDAAFELVAEFDEPAIAIIKHANPCGVALGKTLAEAHAKALACDPVSAFGGIVAANRPLDAATAEQIVAVFTEVVIAPGADAAALAVFAAKKNLRLLLTEAMPDAATPGYNVRNLAGGLLVQTRDTGHVAEGDLTVATQRAPSEAELGDMLFAFRVAKHVKSNAIVYARDRATVGIGAGQMSRLDSAIIARGKAARAGLSIEGAVVASDAFFPFPDGLLEAAEGGAVAAIQPGGSMRDAEVIAAADERGMAMVMTGMRHFRH
ncbi:MAG: bifunctional phosphoribosylaminoimidazolecarboxamide formyltransferase/IMP cyclohydrolase [Proteobacteria bacterium]|nr:bifunctional phosphoribosylaminoimidazolecarboxamide formyltransferase/IMP cyclohydrolase [Pseudomonadota bacterium]MDA1070577.1 bifunctional phosphoribosylaminoimidazolecarboxamide formyltransferase/IMP cyclohydrolase [Pseudomonadota bacterium]